MKIKEIGKETREMKVGNFTATGVSSFQHSLEMQNDIQQFSKKMK